MQHMDLTLNKREWEELQKALVKLQEKYPDSAKRVVQAQAKEAKKQIQSAYIGNILKSRYGKNYKRILKKKNATNKRNLESSFLVGQAIQKGNQITDAVVTKAPHYHLVEDGHEAAGWYEKQTGAKRVPGKKIVARIMGRRSKQSLVMGQKTLDAILKKAGVS